MINLTTRDKEWLLSCLRQTTEALPVGVMAVDAGGRIFIYNRRQGELEGKDPEQMVGKLLAEAAHPAHPTREILTVLKYGQPLTGLHRRYFDDGGQEVNLVTAIYPLTARGQMVAAVAITRSDDLLNYLMKQELQQAGRPPGHLSTPGLSFGPAAPFLQGTDAACRRIRGQMMKAAADHRPVLISGEPGTGKALIAREIHDRGPTRGEPFLTVNCALFPPGLLEEALFGPYPPAGEEKPPGLLEQAGRGTLFLEQVQRMDLPLQSRLLRVMQEKQFTRPGERSAAPDCRLISATGRPPGQLVKEGLLRKDLFLKLAALTIELPPLRERKETIPLVAEHYLQAYHRRRDGEPPSLAAELAAFLAAYPWPGNDRELIYVLQVAAHRAQGEAVLKTSHLPPYLQLKPARPREEEEAAAPAPAIATAGRSLNALLREFEERVIREALAANRGNISQTARRLGLARQGLQYRIKKLGISGFKPDRS